MGRSDLTTDHDRHNDVASIGGTDRLSPQHFDQSLVRFLVPAFDASKLGYAAAFFAVAIISVVGVFAAWRLVRKPAGTEDHHFET